MAVVGKTADGGERHVVLVIVYQPKENAVEEEIRGTAVAARVIKAGAQIMNGNAALRKPKTNHNCPDNNSNVLIEEKGMNVSYFL